MTGDAVTPLPPDIVRCAYLDLVVSDLTAARRFYVDLLGLHVTAEDESAIHLRCFEEFIHHNLVLRQGPVPAVAAFAFRVRTPEDVDRAEAWYRERGCRTERRPGGRVDVRLLGRGGVAVVEIADNGVGMAPEHREKIFLPFYTTKPTGTGLGMAIVKKIGPARRRDRDRQLAGAGDHRAARHSAGDGGGAGGAMRAP